MYRGKLAALQVVKEDKTLIANRKLHYFSTTQQGIYNSI